MLTGQLIFRDTEAPAKRPGHRLMMVCGIVSVPRDMPIKGEHQYIITGDDNGDLIKLVENIHLHIDTAIDLTDVLAGLCLDGMITQPLWRV